jgi:hypothetical protein
MRMQVMLDLRCRSEGRSTLTLEGSSVYNDHRPGRMATGIGRSCVLSYPSGPVNLLAKRQRLGRGRRLAQDALQAGAVIGVRRLASALTRDMLGFSSATLSPSLEFVTTEAIREER